MVDAFLTGVRISPSPSTIKQRPSPLIPSAVSKATAGSSRQTSAAKPTATVKIPGMQRDRPEDEAAQREERIHKCIEAAVLAAVNTASIDWRRPEHDEDAAQAGPAGGRT